LISSGSESVIKVFEIPVIRGKNREFNAIDLIDDRSSFARRASMLIVMAVEIGTSELQALLAL
jgi:hypothetical protein